MVDGADVATPAEKPELTAAELATALEKWSVDAAANGWDKREDEARFLDQAEYLLHTVKYLRSEFGPGLSKA